MKFWLTSILLLSTSIAFSAEEDCDEQTPKLVAAVMNTEKQLRKPASAQECPNLGDLPGLCNAIASRTSDEDPESLYVYKYQRYVYEASCVDLENDNAKEIAKKVNATIKKFEKNFSCSFTQFNVSNGSILKLAVSKLFIDVLEDATNVWKMDLNKVDPTDNRTVLDYTRDQIEKHKGSSIEPTLKKYYDILKKSGAKHKSEL